MIEKPQTGTAEPAASTQSTSLADGEVLAESSAGVGVLTLNRPKALNALSHGMVIAIREQLEAWAQDEEVRAVVVRGAGERGLCAGGDVKSLHGMVTTGRAAEAMVYFHDEYRMNHLIATYPKPYVAFMDGLVLGGGVGVSAHGSHRVVTERTQVGMPETGIGFTPDVGGSWLLARAPHHLGRHLGLTSEFAGPADAIALGFADTLVDSDDLAAILAELREALGGAEGRPGGSRGGGAADAQTAVDEVLSRHASVPGEAPLLAAASWLEPAYAHDAVEKVVAELERVAREHSAEPVREHAAGIVRTLRAKSPTSVKVTFEALRRLEGQATGPEAPGRRDGVACGLRQEFRIASHMTRRHDLAEGIRAQLVDKDRNPQWRPATLEEVTGEIVEAHFSTPADGELTLA